MASWLLGSYTQERPYKIYLVGPDDATTGKFFIAVRHHISSLNNTSGDQLQAPGRDDPEHGITNEFTVIRQPRRAGDATLRYTVINDPSPVVATGAVARLFTDPIDAFIVTFRIDQADDFEAIYRNYMDLVISLCQRQHKPRAPQKVVVLMANRTRVFSSDQAFKSDDMRALMRRTHSAYLSGNFNNAGNCAEMMESVVAEIVAVHREHHRRQQAIAAASSSSGGSFSRTSLEDSSTMLDSLWSSVAEIQRRLLPHCVASEHLYDDDDDDDRRPAMSAEDRLYHAPALSGEQFTPIGQVIGQKDQ